MKNQHMRKNSKIKFISRSIFKVVNPYLTSIKNQHMCKMRKIQFTSTSISKVSPYLISRSISKASPYLI